MRHTLKIHSIVSGRLHSREGAEWILFWCLQRSTIRKMNTVGWAQLLCTTHKTSRKYDQRAKTGNNERHSPVSPVDGIYTECSNNLSTGSASEELCATCQIDRRTSNHTILYEVGKLMEDICNQTTLSYSKWVSGRVTLSRVCGTRRTAKAMLSLMATEISCNAPAWHWMENTDMIYSTYIAIVERWRTENNPVTREKRRNHMWSIWSLNVMVWSYRYIARRRIWRKTSIEIDWLHSSAYQMPRSCNILQCILLRACISRHAQAWITKLRTARWFLEL